MVGHQNSFSTFFALCAFALILCASACGSETKSGVTADPTPPPTEPPPPPGGDYRLQTTIGFSAGGGAVETSRYKARLIIGGVSPNGAASTGLYQAAVGVGSSQHAQVLLYLPGQGE